MDEPLQVISSPLSVCRILSVRQIFSSAMSLPQKLIKRITGSAGAWNESSSAQVGYIPIFEFQALTTRILSAPPCSKFIQ